MLGSYQFGRMTNHINDNLDRLSFGGRTTIQESLKAAGRWEEDGGGVEPLTADSTVYRADNSSITADQTEE